MYIVIGRSSGHTAAFSSQSSPVNNGISRHELTSRCVCQISPSLKHWQPQVITPAYSPRILRGWTAERPCSVPCRRSLRTEKNKINIVKHRLFQVEAQGVVAQTPQPEARVEMIRPWNTCRKLQRGKPLELLPESSYGNDVKYVFPRCTLLMRLLCTVGDITRTNPAPACPARVLRSVTEPRKQTPLETGVTGAPLACPPHTNF